MIVVQHIIDMLNVSGLYALMALGIGLIFGIMRLINFAHGELVMAGGYAIWLLGTFPEPIIIVLSLAAIVALALSIERVAFRPLRGSDPAVLLVSSFAVAYFLQNLAVMVFGARPVPFTFLPGLAQSIDVMGLRVPLLQFVSVGLTGESIRQGRSAASLGLPASIRRPCALPARLGSGCRACGRRG